MTSKPDIKFTKLFINNQFVDAVSGKTFATVDPSDETEIAQIAEGDKADIDKAVKAARKAFEIGMAVWYNIKADCSVLFRDNSVQAQPGGGWMPVDEEG